MLFRNAFITLCAGFILALLLSLAINYNIRRTNLETLRDIAKEHVVAETKKVCANEFGALMVRGLKEEIILVHCDIVAEAGAKKLAEKANERFKLP